MSNPTLDRFSLKGRVVVITGSSGLLGRQHAITVAEAGGTPVLLDIDLSRVEAQAEELRAMGYPGALPLKADVTQLQSLQEALTAILSRLGRVDALVNNAANNPKMESSTADTGWMRFENLPLSIWNQDIAVGLTGAFLCSQVFGTYMAAHGGGVIVNIASDLALISPDQRLYRQPGLSENAQPVKSVTYSVVKTALIGLTRYLATYWAQAGVRVNAISPGGVENHQPGEFIAKLTALIPAGRMAQVDEYKGAMLFLLSDASSYMTGTNLVVDGGRTVW